MKKTILIFTLIFSSLQLLECGSPNADPDRDYRQDMRNFVQGISGYAKGIAPTFIVIPQNGHELLTKDGEETGPPASVYLDAIDGIGREDLFYGYSSDNKPTPEDETTYMVAFLDVAEKAGVEVLVTDYCWIESFMDDSYSRSAAKGYISFAADHRELDNLPVYPSLLFGENSSDITTLGDAQNFLYLINPGSFPSKANFLDEVRGTNYDAIIIDLFFDELDELTFAEVASLKVKSNGGSRLVISYMSIGEAEDYRFYWQMDWNSSPPAWMERENPDWPGNFKVRYWEEDWQDIIYGHDDSYLNKILDAGFDGVYLDIIDAYEYFE
jgi:cysteinyl-tRNA synthetase